MTIDGQDLSEFFRSQMPRPYLEGMLIALFDCYEASDEYCSLNFEPPEAKNLRPFHRRGLIEGQLRELAQQCDGVSAEARQPNGFWSHTLVTAGRVAVTQNSVKCPDDVVRQSQFRSAYAAPDAQKYLFPEFAPEQIDDREEVLYGILIHGRLKGTHVFPGFAQIVFPKEDLGSYWPSCVDLFSEFPEVVRSRTEGLFESDAVEQITEPLPALKNSNAEGINAG